MKKIIIKRKKISKFKCNKVSVLIVLVLVFQPPILRWCLRSSSVIVSSKGKKTKSNKTKQNDTKQKKTTKCPKFKCNTVSVSFSACRCSSVVSSKEERKK
jgi:hypothetical protein